MAISSDFIAATCPEPWQVLGVKLRPFSFGHYLKLARLNCAFVTDGKTEASHADLILAVIVCSMPTAVTFEQDPFWSWLQRTSGGFRYELYKITRKMTGRKIATPAEWDVYRWGKKHGAFDLNAKVKLFTSYMEACSTMPAYVETEKDNPRASGSHWAQSIITALVSKCGYTQEEALNVPMSKAFFDFLKHAESDGAITILPMEVSP